MVNHGNATLLNVTISNNTAGEVRRCPSALCGGRPQHPAHAPRAAAPRCAEARQSY